MKKRHSNRYKHNPSNILKKAPSEIPNRSNVPVQKSLQGDVRNNIMHRSKSSIPKWRAALNASERVINPVYYPLIELMREIDMDPNVHQLKNIRIQNINSRSFTVKDKDGKVDEELTKFFKQEWIYRFFSETISSIFWGYSLFKITGIDTDKQEVMDVVSLKREYFNIKSRQLLTNFQDLSGVSIDDKPYKSWYFSVTPYTELNDYQGLYCSVFPFAQDIKDISNSAIDFIRKYGQPSVVVKTRMTDPDHLSNITGYLNNMQQSPWCILDIDDDISFAEPSSNGADSFITLIDHLSSNICKIILGTDQVPGAEQSFVGSAVQNAIQAAVVSESDIRFVESVFAKCLIPNLVELGLTKLQGCTLELDKTNKASQEAEVGQMLQLLATGAYQIPASYFAEKFGVPITDKAQLNSTPVTDPTQL